MKRCLNKIKLYIGATRAPFLTASIVPVLVGSSLGFTVTGDFNWVLFFLALFAIVFIHAGCNVFNDYFDHKTGADMANKNPTEFSGGSRYIQQGIMSPKAILTEAIVLLIAGSVLGIIIVLITKSILILFLGLAGIILGVFYTAPPFKLCYRGLGEIVIAILFGILPVIGSYWLQLFDFLTFFGVRSDRIVIVPALIVAILVFLIILINEFPDIEPDAQSGKKTLVVRFGIKPCIIIYRIALVISYVFAIASFWGHPRLFWVSLFYLFTAPLAVAVFRLANIKELTNKDRVVINRLTVLLHLVGGLALTAGFIVSHFTR